MLAGEVDAMRFVAVFRVAFLRGGCGECCKKVRWVEIGVVR